MASKKPCDSTTQFKLSRNTLLPLLCSNKLSSQVQQDFLSALCQIITDTSSLGDLSNCFLGYTQLLHTFPHNPVLWHNRGLVLLEMGYRDLAYWDLQRALCLMQWVIGRINECADILSILQLLYIKQSKDTVKEIDIMMTYILYTTSRNLITSDWGSRYIQDGLNYLALANIGYKKIHPEIHDKMKNLKELGEKKYSNLQTTEGSENDLISRKKLLNGRYPWDLYDIRKKAAQTKEELSTFTKGCNEVLRKLKTDNVEVRISCVELTTSEKERGNKKGSKAKTKDIQISMFAKKSIRKGSVLFQERPFITVNNRLYTTKCHHCQTRCLHSDRHYPCSSCKEIFCSKKCFDYANNQYHKILCGRQDRFESLYRLFQKGISTSSLWFFYLIKVIAMSLQMQIPILELPGLRYLRPSSVEYNTIIGSPSFEKYFMILSAFEIGPKMWLDFDYWIYDTASRLLENNSFGEYEGVGKPSNGETYEVISWFNHSCDPNCIQSRDGIKSRRFIKAGEELTISYCDANLSKSDRQYRLMVIYGFNCKCLRCESE